MITKVCTKCGKRKSLDKYYKDKQKSTGYRPDCKVCNTEKCKTWASKNRNKRKFHTLKFNTGLTEVQYKLLLSKQNNRCAICRKKSSKYLSVDHNHKTNIVRGLLCTKCNFGLGYFNDNDKLLRNSIKYLKSNLSVYKFKFKSKKK